MGKVNDGARSRYPQERKYRRFNLRYPVRVKFASGDTVAELEAFSRNVSIGGVLLETASMIPQHVPLSFVMTVQGGRILCPIQLRGEGEVVRVEPEESAGFTIAVECKHPIAHMEDYLTASVS